MFFSCRAMLLVFFCCVLGRCRVVGTVGRVDVGVALGRPRVGRGVGTVAVVVGAFVTLSSMRGRRMNGMPYVIFGMSTEATNCLMTGNDGSLSRLINLHIMCDDIVARLTNCLRWGKYVRCWSNHTPKYLYSLTATMFAPPSLSLCCSCVGSSIRRSPSVCRGGLKNTTFVFVKENLIFHLRAYCVMAVSDVRIAVSASVPALLSGCNAISSANSVSRVRGCKLLLMSCTYIV